MDRYLKNILSTPEQLNLGGLESENLFVLRGSRPDGIIVCGMGGSGLAGMILCRSKKELGLELPVFSWKDYGVPSVSQFGLKHPLCVFVSFSGDTEETISGFKEAIGKRGVSLAVITTGGKLLKLARQNDVPLVQFPADDLAPRQGVGKMFYALIQILQSAHLISRRVPKYRSLDARADQNTGRRLARKIFKKTTIIYADRGNYDLAYLWKISLNETGKQLAFTNVLPELHHNEINGFQKSSGAAIVLILKPPKPSAQMEKRFQVTKTILKNFGVPFEELALAGKTRLETVWRTLMLTEWAGYYLAGLHKINPAAIPAVDTIKQFLKK
ncbi:MAG: SIS domain-containing protein [Candidatus Liptonbacteria bacterium]